MRQIVMFRFVELPAIAELVWASEHIGNGANGDLLQSCEGGDEAGAVKMVWKRILPTAPNVAGLVLNEWRSAT